MQGYRIVHFVGPPLVVLIVADLFAQIGTLFGERVLAISSGVLFSAFGVYWWLTERSRYGAGYRAWREERRLAPIREEAQKIAEKEAGHVKSLLFWFQGYR